MHCIFQAIRNEDEEEGEILCLNKRFLAKLIVSIKEKKALTSLW